jgi:hypothetical protein
LRNVIIKAQPNDYTCGPTCLQAVYNYYGENIDLNVVIDEVHSLENGGTLSVLLANHALRKGYKATIYNYNLEVFDPTWFPASNTELLMEKLKNQMEAKKNKKLKSASNAYIEFLKLGGELKFEDLSPQLLSRLFNEETPVLTGLSATYLYQCAREYSYPDGSMIYDDVGGEPTGHFVVLNGFNENEEEVLVADPYKSNPVSGTNYYFAPIQRLINSILLGIITYDANLLIIEPNIKI